MFPTRATRVFAAPTAIFTCLLVFVPCCAETGVLFATSGLEAAAAAAAGVAARCCGEGLEAAPAPVLLLEEPAPRA